MSWPRFRKLFDLNYARSLPVTASSQTGGPMVKDLFSFWRLTLSGGHQKAGTLTGGALCAETPHSLIKSLFLKLNGQTLIELPGTDLRVVHLLANNRDVVSTPTVATTDVTTSFRAVYFFDFLTKLSDFARRTLLAANRYDTVEFGINWGNETDFHSGAYATTHAITSATKVEVEAEMFTGIPEFHVRNGSPVEYWHRRFQRTTFEILATSNLKEFPIPLGETIARIYLKEYTDANSFETPVNNIINAQGALELWFNGNERKFQYAKDKLDELVNDTRRITLPTGYHVIDFMRDDDYANAMRTDAGSGIASLSLKADVTTQSNAKLRCLLETFVPSL
jgi:hypothetical protein